MSQPQYSVKCIGLDYHVLENGKSITSRRSWEGAHSVIDRLQRPKMRERKCMTCGAPFMSEGPHNRLCNTHRHDSIYDGSA